MIAKTKGQLHRILFTGGPCAGKTTVLAKMQENLEAKGFRVFCVPEAATLLNAGGVSLANDGKTWDFQL